MGKHKSKSFLKLKAQNISQKLHLLRTHVFALLTCTWPGVMPALLLSKTTEVSSSLRRTLKLDLHSGTARRITYLKTSYLACNTDPLLANPASPSSLKEKRRRKLMVQTSLTSRKQSKSSFHLSMIDLRLIDLERA